MAINPNTSQWIAIQTVDSCIDYFRFNDLHRLECSYRIIVLCFDLWFYFCCHDGYDICSTYKYRQSRAKYQAVFVLIENGDTFCISRKARKVST